MLPAPLAGYSDRSFRDIARRFGCDLVFTEMISAEGLIRNHVQTWRLADITGEPSPVSCQIFGNRADSLAEAARMLAERGASMIDINLGCPVRKVIRNGSGAALLNEPDRVAEIARALRRALSIPYTFKLRSGTEDHPRACIELARILESEGASALTLHPRTMEQVFRGRASWELIGEMKRVAGIPVIGSGDIESGDDARRMLDETGCDAVMIGRGALGNPWLFLEAQASLGEIPGEGVVVPSTRDKILTAIGHLESLVEKKGEKRGVKEFRKHAMTYLKGCPFARHMRSEFFQLNVFSDVKDFLTEIANA